MAFIPVYLILIGCFHCLAVRTYLYEARDMKFEDAKEKCRSLGMDMALALDDDDIDAMNEHLAHLKSDVEAWLGLVYSGNGKEFNWLNGDSLSADRWDVTTDNEPDKLNDQHCVVWRRRDNQWDTRECSKKYHVLCSIDRSSDITTATFTVYKENRKLTGSASATVTSQSNIDCAMACRHLEDCAYFTIETTTMECSLYTSKLVPTSRFSYHTGTTVWKMN